MTEQEKAKWFIQHPVALGRAIGYKDLRDDIHGRWLDAMIYSKKDFTLQAHRGSFKTSCLTLAIALLMIKDRDRNIMFLRKTDNDVAEVIKATKRILTSPVMQEIYLALTGEQLQIARDNSFQITLTNYTAARGAAQLQGMGIGGSLTGKHADILITDDVINLKDRLSKTERDRTKGIIQELQNIRNPGGRFINTGTPWHKDDAFTLMPEPMMFDCYSTGLLSQEQIETLRQSMSPSLFAANYELRHIAAENVLFDKAPVFTNDPEYLRDGIAHVDAAYGGEDFTAFTCGRRVGDTIFMYGRMWHCHVDTVMDAIIEEATRLKCAPIMCETNGDKGYLGKELKRRGASARMYTERENKFLKISTFLRKWWPHIVWLEGTDRDYLAQILDYTEEAEHDDAPDSAACMARWWDKRVGGYVSPFVFE